MLPAPNRLRRRGDFTSAVRGAGSARAGNRLLVVHCRAADSRTGLPPRVGFVVSKALGGAVVRNRVKRRLRAIMYAALDRIPTGMDVVVRATPNAAEASFADLRCSLIPLLDKGIVRAGDQR